MQCYTHTQQQLLNIHAHFQAVCSLVLTDLAEGSASLHLEALLDSAAQAIESPDDSGSAKPDMSLPLTLVGFSKGAVVLNQLVTELAGATQRCSRANRSNFGGVGQKQVVAADPRQGENSWGKEGRRGGGRSTRQTRKRPRVASSMPCSGCSIGEGGSVASVRRRATSATNESDLRNEPSVGTWGRSWSREDEHRAVESKERANELEPNGYQEHGSWQVIRSVSDA